VVDVLLHVVGWTVWQSVFSPLIATMAAWRFNLTAMHWHRFGASTPMPGVFKWADQSPTLLGLSCDSRRYQYLAISLLSSTTLESKVFHRVLRSASLLFSSWPSHVRNFPFLPHPRRHAYFLIERWSLHYSPAF